VSGRDFPKVKRTLGNKPRRKKSGKEKTGRVGGGSVGARLGNVKRRTARNQEKKAGDVLRRLIGRNSLQRGGTRKGITFFEERKRGESLRQVDSR